MLNLILASSLAANAAAAPVSASDQIVVEGQRNRKQAIHDYIGAVTPAPIGGQLGRFRNPVCPAAAGLPDSKSRAVVARLRQVASAIGLQIASLKCAPNALLVVVDDKDDFIAALKKRYPDYFADLVQGSIKLPHEPGPALAWQIGGLLDANGIAAGRTPTYVHGVNLNSEGLRTGDQPMGHYYVTSSVDSSRIRPSTTLQFLTAIVVVERRALAGLTMIQLADYAAMRLYATTEPRKLKSSASSILGAIDAPPGATVPLSLTSWDLSFLKGLYSTDPRQHANGQRNEIERRVIRETVDSNTKE